MNEWLIKINRELNDDEKKYRERFIKLLTEMTLPLQAGEIFCQCLDTAGDYLYYNPMWFVSNYGYVISVARNTFYELKPSLKTGGWERHGETRWTEYIQMTYPQWRRDQERGWEPQYYFYGNSYPNKRGLNNSSLHPIAQKLVALYFLPEDERMKVLNPLYIVHHIQSFDWNRSSKYNNRANNLQVLLEQPQFNVNEYPEKRQHKFIHNSDRATSQVNVERLMKKIQESDVPHYVFLQPGGLERFVLSGLRANPDAAVSVSAKNEDGSTYMNAYYSGADLKRVDD